MRSKYRAVPTTVHGIRFASKAEAKRYGELLYLGYAGEVRNLELQPRFDLRVDGKSVGTYVADFRYEARPSPYNVMWRDVVEDVKGVRTPVYKLKKKLVEAQYGLTIQEVRMR